MKKLFILFIVLNLLQKGFSQTNTNTFPASGNVGIGTISPYGTLDLGQQTGLKFFYYGNGGNTGYISGIGLNLTNSVNVINNVIGGSAAANSGTATWAITRGNGSYPYSSYTDIFTVDSRTGNANFSGTVSAAAITSTGQIQSDVTTTALYYGSTASTAASLSLANIIHYQADQGTFGSGSAVTTQIGFQASGNLIGATNNYGFYGNIASGTSRWNVYMAGTAANYFAGQVGIGTTSPGGAADAIFSVRMNSATHNSSTIAYLASFNRVNSNTAAWYFGSDITNNAVMAANNANMIFGKDVSGTFSEYMRINTSGNLLIGKTSQINPNYKLDVAGNARINKVVVNTTGADFVFDSTYQLAPLNEVAKYIQQNKHLPGIEPAKQMQEEGLNVGDNQTKLLQKIEELTLYLIAQNKKIEGLEKKIKELTSRN